MNPALEDLLRHDGVIVRRHHQHLRGAIDWALSQGELTSVSPGVLVAATEPIPWQVICQAISAFSADAVITGAAAAALTFWPELRVATVSAFHPHPLASSALIAWHRAGVPADWVLDDHGFRLAAPAWTAVEICGAGNADSIDRALRARVPLAELWRALDSMPHRRGNPIRRRLLRDSRDQPWSAAERLAHRIFREAGIKGWQTNYPFAGYFLDIAFPAERVYIEIDGYEFHSSRQSHEHDSFRGQVLAANGWTVLHVTWRQLTEDAAGVVARVNATLRRRRRLRGLVA